MRTEQIVAKALEQVNNDRYILSNMIFKRVKQLNNGAQILIKADLRTEKLTDIALREIEQNIEHYARVKYGQEEPVYCGKCDYCKSVKEAHIRNYSELLEGL